MVIVMRDGWEVEYVRTVLKRTGLSASALAKQAGFAPSTLIRALNDTNHKFRLSTSTLEKIKAATEIPYLGEATKDSISTTTLHENALIMVYDIEASAGFGSIVEREEVVCNMAFDKSFIGGMTSAKGADLAIIRVKGHSMEPTLLDDDHVLVDRTKTNLSWDGMFVLRFDDALHVKRIGRSSIKGNVMVISDHPAYPSLDMAAADLTVIGRVLWVGRKV